MKRITLLLPLLMLASIVHAQLINFEDGFSDGDFSRNPEWSGDIYDFRVERIGFNFLLRLQGGLSGPSYLSTPSSAIDGSWEFFVRFKNFEPSGSNRVEVFLMSDLPDLRQTVNGYAVTAGEAGHDVFRLLRFDQGLPGRTLLSDTTTIDPKGGGYRLKVTRNSEGSWKMEVGKGYGGTLYGTGDTVVDRTHASSSHFGVKVHYTSTRSDRYFFDFKIDLPPFSVVKAVSAPNAIDVHFNRAYDPSTVRSSDFSVTPRPGTPGKISFPAADIVRLHYYPPLPSGKYTLQTGPMDDRNGEPLIMGLKIPFTVYGKLSGNDIVINEIMYDPFEGQTEYVELLNTGGKIFNLMNWTLSDGGTPRAISSDTLELPPHGYLVLSGNAGRLHHTYGPGPYTDMDSFPSLNKNDNIVLTAGDNQRSDSVGYSDSWHNPNRLDHRGLSLERIQPGGAGNDLFNWSSSTHHLGGTPGRENSIYQSPRAPTGNSGMSFAPNPFSPDDDGRDDRLFIQYRLDHPDYLIGVQIYDRHGRPVRRLADNKPAGFEGSLIWDGRKDDGSSNRIGIYIVVFEAFNSAAGKNLAFKKTVVLARGLR